MEISTSMDIYGTRMRNTYAFLSRLALFQNLVENTI